MNLLPSIKKPNRSFKFSNPLSGVIYNNDNFLKQCNYSREANKNSISVKEKSYSLPKNVKNKARKNHRTISVLGQPANMYDQDPQKSLNKTGSHFFKATQQNIQPKNDNQIYQFQDVQVQIIDAIDSYNDYREKKLQVSLSKYFCMFFKKNLAGPLTREFIATVERLIEQMQKEELDSPISFKDFPSSYFRLNNKKEFLTKIQELQFKKQTSAIQAIVKYYCVPSSQLRASCLRDIIHLLRSLIYEKFNISKEKDYVLLNSQGNLIQEFIDIKFSTRCLIITQREDYPKRFARYAQIIDENELAFQKLSFSEGLKKSFRNRIVNGRFEQKKEREELPSPKKASEIRKNAEKNLTEHKRSNKSLTCVNLANTATNFSPKKSERSKSKQHRSKSQLDRVPDLSSRMSTFSARKREDKYLSVFQHLYNQNSFYDITFNHENDNKVLMVTLKKNFDLFKNKNEDQISAILYGFGIEKQRKFIEWEQFKTINEVANCKGAKQDIVDFVNKYMPFNEYGQMDRRDLATILDFILCHDPNRDVIEEVIWSWLQRNNLVENGKILRTTLSSWYKKNKLVYVMLISLIFGTNHISSIDMAYEVIL